VLKLQKYVAMGLLTVGSVMAQPATRTFTWSFTVEDMLSHVVITPNEPVVFNSDNASELKNNITQVGTMHMGETRLYNIGTNNISLVRDDEDEVPVTFYLKRFDEACPAGNSSDTEQTSNGDSWCVVPMANGMITSIYAQDIELFIKINNSRIESGHYTFTAEVSIQNPT
jgi:hypothetical protein